MRYYRAQVVRENSQKMWIVTTLKVELRIRIHLFQVTKSNMNYIRHKLEFVKGTSNQKKKRDN